MKMLKSTLAVMTAAAVLGVSGFAQAGATLDAVQKKGFVQCGVSDGLPNTGRVLNLMHVVLLMNCYAMVS